MTTTEIDVEEVFKNFRDLIGNQAQEIAILKTAITKLEASLSEERAKSSSTESSSNSLG